MKQSVSKTNSADEKWLSQSPLFPVLVEALQELLKEQGIESKLVYSDPSAKAPVPLNPLYFLASYLMRNNPLHQSSYARLLAAVYFSFIFLVCADSSNPPDRICSRILYREMMTHPGRYEISVLPTVLSAAASMHDVLRFSITLESSAQSPVSISLTPI